MKTTIMLVGMTLALALMAAPAVAGSIPYGSPGTINSEIYPFIAAFNGDVTVYFYGSSADYSSEITLLLNSQVIDASTAFFLPNHSSAYGAAATFNNVKAGDILVFVLKITTGTPGLLFYSDPARNSDSLQHVYSADFAGDAFIPAGKYVAFEDIVGGGDKDYNDHQFVFTNVSIGGGEPVPEPGSTLLLLGIGFVPIALGYRRWQK
jgi:hypothetical protein